MEGIFGTDIKIRQQSVASAALAANLHAIKSPYCMHAHFMHAARPAIDHRAVKTASYGLITHFMVIYAGNILRTYVQVARPSAVRTYVNCQLATFMHVQAEEEELTLIE
jgi:hypothetical protein